MAMSDMYGPSDESESIATIQTAIDAGITWIDTGDFYGMGHNEMLIRRAIEAAARTYFLAVKFGAMRGSRKARLRSGNRSAARQAVPRNSCTASALGDRYPI